MANFKKIDDHDFVFVNKPLTAQQEKEFSQFLKNRKAKTKAKPIAQTVTRVKVTT